MKRTYFRIRNPFASFRKSMLRRMLAVSLFASIFPVIFVGFSSYWFSSSAIRKEVDQANARVLSHASYSIDTALQRVRSNALQMLLGSFFNGNLTEQKWANYAGFYSNLFQNLSSLQNSNAEISHIVMYIAEDDYLVSPDQGGHKVAGEEDRRQLQGLLASREAMYWSNDTFRFMGDAPGGQASVTLVCQVPFQAAEPIGLLLLQLNPSFLQENMTRFSAYPGELSFILNEEGREVVSSAGQPAPQGLYEQAGEHPGQAFSFPWEGRDYLVTALHSSSNGWTYLDMVPLQELNAKSRGIAVITVAIVLVFLLLGAAATAWSTKRLYRPIEHLVSLVRGNREEELLADEIGYVQSRWAELNQATTRLQTQLNRQLPAIREAFALQWLQGHYAHYTSEQLPVLFERYAVPYQHMHAVFALAYDQSPDGSSRFRESDKELIVFTMKNIAQDVLAQQGASGMVVNLLNDQIAVWLWEDTEDPAAWFAQVQELAAGLRTVLADYLKLPVTAGLGDGPGAPGGLPRLFAQAAMAIRSRFWAGTGQVIRSGDGDAGEAKSYPYPFEIEAGLEQALRNGDAAEAELQLEQFAAYAQETLRETERIRTAYYQLLTAALRVVFLLNLSLRESADGTGDETDLYVQIKNVHSIQELNDWFRERLIRPIARKVQQRHHQEYERTFETAIAYIEANHHIDLSLDQVAERCGLSPPYFSKLFKRIIGVSFIEYLTAYRIDRAKTLLQTTGLSVAEVAEGVGYQPKNFIRVFKKQTGQTPGQFRETGSA